MRYLIQEKTDAGLAFFGYIPNHLAIDEIKDYMDGKTRVTGPTGVYFACFGPAKYAKSFTDRADAESVVKKYCAEIENLTIIDAA